MHHIVLLRSPFFLRIATVFFSFLITGCQKAPKKNVKVKYPETKKIPLVDTFFGQQVVDPYRWLEDDRSKDTEEWVKDQNEVTFHYLKQIPFRDKIEKRLSRLWNYEKISAPFQEGKYTYYYKNDGLQNQYVVYRKDQSGVESVFLDPNSFSEDGTTSLGQLSFSKDGSLAAYSISEGGSDWRKVIVIDAETREVLEDTLVDIKFSGISWYGQKGFYYSSYKKPDGSELSAKTDHHKLYYHQLGTPQSDDIVIFGNVEGQKRRYVGGRVTEDDRFLFISGAVSTSGNDLYVMDLDNPKAELKSIVDQVDNDVYLLDNEGESFYLVTNLDAPNKRIVKTTFDNPSAETWKDVIPEKKEVLSPSTGGGFIFAEYMKDAVSSIVMYQYDGTEVQEIQLPGVGSAGGFSGKKNDSVLYYSFTNYNTPASIYSFQVEKRESKLYWSPKIDFNPAHYESKQVFYTSKDGTKIPLIITYKKGIKRNGINPTILYGYGGFNVSLTPSFSPVNAVWMEMGGVYAVANLRGGGEYGKNWHVAGTKMKKQNVFDDFISAAHYLIDEKYTNQNHLAIRGGSNGGLLVGAVMTQRPDLIQVALPAVGVLDMLRYHTFTSGAGWAYDYGTAEDSKEMFQYLLGYSPVHNVKEGTDYPATLITTGDHDDRVVPAHSFKFAAQLQANHEGDAPVLIRIETNAGHGDGTPVSKTLQQYADIFAFTLYNMNVTPNLEN